MTGDRIQRRAQLVRHHREKIRLRSARALGLLECSLQLVACALGVRACAALPLEQPRALECLRRELRRGNEQRSVHRRETTRVRKAQAHRAYRSIRRGQRQRDYSLVRRLRQHSGERWIPLVPLGGRADVHRYSGAGGFCERRLARKRKLRPCSPRLVRHLLRMNYRKTIPFRNDRRHDAANRVERRDRACYCHRRDFARRLCRRESTGERCE